MMPCLHEFGDLGYFLPSFQLASVLEEANQQHARRLGVEHPEADVLATEGHLLARPAEAEARAGARDEAAVLVRVGAPLAGAEAAVDDEGEGEDERLARPVGEDDAHGAAGRVSAEGAPLAARRRQRQVRPGVAQAPDARRAVRLEAEGAVDELAFVPVAGR